MSRYLKLFYAVLIGLIIFSLFRIGILITYFEQFKDNSFTQILFAMVHGIRFDASIFMTIILPFIVLLLLPVNNRIYEKIVYWALYLVYFIMIIYLMIDAVYFGYVSRHLAGEFAQLGQDKEYISTMGFEYWWLVLLVFLAGFTGAYFWNKLVRIEIKKSEYNKKANIRSAIYFLIAGIIVFILIRGSFDIKPISTINAFISGNNSLGNLTLNGLFTSIRYMTENRNLTTDIYNFYDDNETHQFILSLKSGKCEKPFHFNDKPNIVFILLESWSAYYVDSFNGNKIITTGGGGAITAHDTKVVDHIRYLSTQAKADVHYYIHNEVGYNYRMTNLQAALGVAQLEELPEFIRRKQRNYKLYCQLFEGFELGHMIGFRSDIDSNMWFYSLEINRDKVKATMKEIITKLEEKGVQTRAIWGLINEQLPYIHEVTYKLEKAPYYAERILNIPSSTQITEEEIHYVAENIKKVLEESIGVDIE